MVLLLHYSIHFILDSFSFLTFDFVIHFFLLHQGFAFAILLLMAVNQHSILLTIIIRFGQLFLLNFVIQLDLYFLRVFISFHPIVEDHFKLNYSLLFHLLDGLKLIIIANQNYFSLNYVVDFKP